MCQDQERCFGPYFWQFPLLRATACAYPVYHATISLNYLTESPAEINGSDYRMRQMKTRNGITDRWQGPLVSGQYTWTESLDELTIHTPMDILLSREHFIRKIINSTSAFVFGFSKSLHDLELFFALNLSRHFSNAPSLPSDLSRDLTFTSSYESFFVFLFFVGTKPQILVY